MQSPHNPHLAGPNPARWFRPTPAVDFDAIHVSANLKEHLRAEIRSMTHPIREKLSGAFPPSAYLFYGPPGSGKSTVISAFVSGLMDRGYRHMQVSLADIQSSLVGESEKNIDTVFRTAMDAAPCVLVMPDVEHICSDRTNPLLPFYRMNLTNAFLAAFRQMQHSGREVVFIGETSAPWELDQVLADWCRMIRLSYPDADTRARYLRGKLSLEQPGRDWLMQPLLEITANTSFRYIDRLLYSIQLQLRSQSNRDDDAVTPDMLNAALAENPPINYSRFLRKLKEYETESYGSPDL